MKVRSEKGREALYIGCVFMPTDSTIISFVDSCYEMQKMYLVLRRREWLFCLVISMRVLVDPYK